MMQKTPGSFPKLQSAFTDPFNPSAILAKGNWNVMGNGRIYTLTIESSLAASYFSSGIITAIAWDVTLYKLTFTRKIPTGPNTFVYQDWIGYLLANDNLHDNKWRIAGTFGEQGTAETAGWYATILKEDATL